MFVLVGQMKKPPSMSTDEFRRWWKEEHVPHVLRIPGVSHYTVVPVDAVYEAVAGELSEQTPFDGVAVLHFEDRDSMLKVLSSPEGETNRQHMHSIGLRNTIVVGEGETLINRLPPRTAEESQTALDRSKPEE
jgi:uncharacterized protein (TIGR02118 family)